jgi:hypothetical protein
MWLDPANYNRARRRTHHGIRPALICELRALDHLPGKALFRVQELADR